MPPHPPEPTPELVLGLWDHLERHYGSVTVPKERSPVMRTAAVGLSALGILERRAFMDRFTTVIGRRIYAPFTPGEAATMPLLSQMDTCIHEHQHVVQLIREGRARFWGRYLASPRSRALYEAEAYTCGLELQWWYRGVHAEPRIVAKTLEHYGCGAGDVAAATAVLEENAARVRAGEIVTEAMRVARCWLEDRS